MGLDHGRIPDEPGPVVISAGLLVSLLGLDQLGPGLGGRELCWNILLTN